MTSRLPTALAGVVALMGDAIRATRAYEQAGSTAARRRALDDFASGTHPSA